MTNQKQEHQPLRKLQYTVKDLTYVWSMGETKVRQWLDEGRCPSYKIDGTRFVHYEDAELFTQKLRPADQQFDLEI